MSPKQVQDMLRELLLRRVSQGADDSAGGQIEAITIFGADRLDIAFRDGDLGHLIITVIPEGAQS